MVQLMPLHPKTSSSLASFKSRLVLLLWYQLTQVVLEKRPLNGCSSSDGWYTADDDDNDGSYLRVVLCAGGSVLEAMAEAVEKAAVVLVCLTQKYKESPNCRTGTRAFVLVWHPITVCTENVPAETSASSTLL